jgi:DNA-binding NarL/FixJ family response regulator
MTLQTQVSVFDRRARGNEGSRRPHLTLHKDEPPSPAPPDPPWAAALEAHETAAPCASLSAVWQDVLDGRLTVVGHKLGPSRQLVLARATACPRRLNRLETAVLVRVLCGEQQKVVAAELGIACSTASKWFTLALRKLNLDGGPLPLLLVLAAQSWGSGDAVAVGARRAVFEHEGEQFHVLSVPRPSVTGERCCLTDAEQAVARLLIEGGSRWEIAVLRSTSAQTIACQLRGIFVKFRLTGRHALIRHVAGLGWFR